MLESGWLFVGRIAFAWTLVTVIAAAYVDPADSTGDAIAMVGGAVGTVLWAVWTFGAFNVELVDGGVAYTFTHPELAIVGVSMAVPCAYILLTGPVELVNRARQPQTDEI